MYTNRVEGLFAALKISSTGLTAQRRRLNAIAENLANVHTTRTPEGGPFKRRITRLTEMSQQSSFLSNLTEKRLALSTPRIGHRGLDFGTAAGEFTGGRPTRELDDSDPILVYDPQHNFTPTPFVRPENQDAKTALMLFYGNLCWTQLRKHGVCYGLDPSVAS